MNQQLGAEVYRICGRRGHAETLEESRDAFFKAFTRRLRETLDEETLRQSMGVPAAGVP
jgi:hypothetical protein